MKLEIIDLLMCPSCEKESWDRKFELMGDFNDTKIFDGYITCTRGHRWQVRDELLRFHLESGEEMLYDPLPVPGPEEEFFPFPLDKQGKKSYMTAIQRLTELLEGEIYAVFGNIVPLVEALGATDKLFLLFSDDERELRKAQEVAAMNGAYDSFFFIRANDFPLNPEISLPTVSILSEVESLHRVALLDSPQGELLGKFEGKFLVYT